MSEYAVMDTNSRVAMTGMARVDFMINSGVWCFEFDVVRSEKAKLAKLPPAATRELLALALETERAEYGCPSIAQRWSSPE